MKGVYRKGEFRDLICTACLLNENTLRVSAGLFEEGKDEHCIEREGGIDWMSPFLAQDTIIGDLRA